MAKYSYAGIFFKEKDNTIRSNALPGLGIGAIVMKSNKGPVNQRILTSSYNQFTNIFGEPEQLDDYGHFAADNYLSVSNQLLAVRTTMGDEGYAQIQFPYTDADLKDVVLSQDTAQFKYIDNEDDNKLKLLDNLETVTDVSALSGKTGKEEWIIESPLSSYGVYQRASFGTIVDLISDNAPSVAVFKNYGKGETMEWDAVETNKGAYIEFASKVDYMGNVSTYYNDLILTKNAWEEGELDKSSIVTATTALTFISGTTTAKGYRTVFSIPSGDTLDSLNRTLTAYYSEDFISTISADSVSSVPYQQLFNPSSFYKGQYDDSTKYCSEPVSASKIEFMDWDDCTVKTHYVNTEEFSASFGKAVGIQYREYGMNSLQEALAANFKVDGKDYEVECKAFTDIVTDPASGFDKVNEIANEYGCDASELLANGKYSLLTYYDVWNGIEYETDETSQDTKCVNEPKQVVVYTKEWKEFTSKHENENFDDKLFWIYAEKDKKVTTTQSVYTADTPEPVVIPWQANTIKDDSDKPITKMAAYPTSEILNGTNERYKNGYTVSIESDDEPGNGDIEQYVSNKSNQLIIASIGPGEYGNDIGVSIITTACADIPALNHPNAFNWKNKYDDDDQVEADVSDDLTWKKVYRINVYVKPKSKTAAAAWGTGMDALLKDPDESWYVSNDPTAKDNEGNSLYAPNVINGHSDYIYVSRNSVNEAKTGAGTYAQPHQTFAIYGLTGGSNSKKNNMTEKIAGLKLYADRQKANFDILFNVEAIDTFNGKQRYGALQRKIAEIASSRTMDIGVIQTTSREAKSIKRMVGEGKMFSFNNGSYVAAYAGYDKYYNDTLASWIYLPKSVAAARSMAYCDMTEGPWMAPAGVARGRIPYTNGQLTTLNDVELGQLGSINVNGSRDCAGFGECLYAHWTCLKKESALNRINVRRCLNFIEKSLETMLLPYLFQNNTSNTRSSARNTIDAFLSRLQAADGIVEYSLTVEQDNEDPHILNVVLEVVPAEAIEAIMVTINVNRTTGITTSESL